MPSPLRSFLVRQFSQPSGMPGVLAGWVMAARRSNRERNQRTVELLDLRPRDRVVEIGFGPGLALRWLWRKRDDRASSLPFLLASPLLARLDGRP